MKYCRSCCCLSWSWFSHSSALSSSDSSSSSSHHRWIFNAQIVEYSSPLDNLSSCYHSSNTNTSGQSVEYFLYYAIYSLNCAFSFLCAVLNLCCGPSTSPRKGGSAIDYKYRRSHLEWPPQGTVSSHSLQIFTFVHFFIVRFVVFIEPVIAIIVYF